MRTRANSAFGIDVTEGGISTVLLGKTAGRCRVLDAAQFPLPEGTYVQGRLIEPTHLLKALKAVRRHNKTRTPNVVMSLPSMGTVTRVVPLDEGDPQRIAEFVRSEIKEYAALSGRDVVSDFRVLVPVSPNASGKVLMTAMDSHLAVTANWICRRARVDVGVVEPAGMACLRMAGDLGATSPMLVAVVKEGGLSLSVLRGGGLEFIRTETIATPADGPQIVYGRVADEINSVIQFYQRENTGGTDAWRVVVLDDDDSILPDDVRSFLKANVVADTVDIRTPTDCFEAIDLVPQVDGPASITALGLALRFLVEDKNVPRISLLPPEAIRAKSLRTNALLTANAVAVVVLVAVLIVGGFRLTTKRVCQSVAAMQQTSLQRGQQALTAGAMQLAYIEQQRTSLTKKLAFLRRISESHAGVNWPELLDDIKDATPEVVCVTDLAADAASGLSVEGLSRSYEGVHLFVEMLKQSEKISEASVIETGRDSSASGLVRYVVQCTLASGETP